MQYFGGVSSDTSSDNLESTTFASLEKSANVKAGSSSNVSNNQSEEIGVAVFKDDKLVGELTAIETIFYLILTNKLESGSISVPNPYNLDSNIDLYIYKRKNTKSTVKFINNSPYINVKINLKARINSTRKQS